MGAASTRPRSAAGHSPVPSEDDPDGEGPDGGDEGEERPSCPEFPDRRTRAWLATLGTVSARPVARRMSEGELANTCERTRTMPVPVRAISFTATQRISHR